MRRAFNLPARPVLARLYSTALGLYDAQLNGVGVTQDLLRPGWTDYGIRTAYQTYDVTELVRGGKNVVGAILGDGWYSGHVAWSGRGVYGKVPRLKMQLEIDCADGSKTVLGTDADWRAFSGPLRKTDLLMGEVYDARLERPGASGPRIPTPPPRPLNV